MARVVPFLVVVLAASPASADVFKLYGELQGGGLYGKGVGGDSSFFEQSKGAAYGVTVGGRFLFIDGNISHHQFPTATQGDLTTWTQFSAGMNFQIDTGSEEDKKAHKSGYVEIGTWLGFGVATGAQVDPPLDNSEVTDKGFVLQGRFGFGKHLSSIFDIGLQVPVSYGYIFRNGTGVGANDPDSQYQSVQVEGLLVLRANVKLL